MEREELEKRVAQLESLNDQLASELKYLDQILRLVGFVDGLRTVKTVTEEIIQEQMPEKDDLAS